jgi:hypothetical protein
MDGRRQSVTAWGIVVIVVANIAVTIAVIASFIAYRVAHSLRRCDRSHKALAQEVATWTAKILKSYIDVRLLLANVDESTDATDGAESLVVLIDQLGAAIESAPWIDVQKLSTMGERVRAAAPADERS